MMLVNRCLYVKLLLTVPALTFATDYFVSPAGSDTQTGLAIDKPLATIQRAIDNAGPGDTIHLAHGTYRQDLISKRAGTASQPILIEGGQPAIIRGAGKGRIIQINHSYIHLKGFTVDGLHGDARSKSGYRDKLIFIQSPQANIPIKGISLSGLHLRNAGGECLRLRYLVQYSEIANNAFSNCGIHDFVFNDGGKNGEAVYIGTAPEQLNDGKNPNNAVDASNNNRVHHNYMDTRGNECVDIKEGSSGNIVEHNVCTGQRDAESAGLDARGNGNTFRYNESYGNLGAGVRLGGDTGTDGIYNHVYGNVIYENQGGGIKVQRTPQGALCGNTMRDNNGGDSVGTYGSKYRPTAPCPAGETPSSDPAPPPPSSGPAQTVDPAATATLITIADTFVRDGAYAERNFGAENVISAKQSGTDSNRKGLVKFSLKNLSGITSAKLRLYGAVSRSASVSIGISPTESNWAESTVNWTTQPKAQPIIGNITVDSTTYKWYSIDISGPVRDALAASRSTLSLELHGLARTDAVVSFASRESGRGSAMLEIHK